MTCQWWRSVAGLVGIVLALLACPLEALAEEPYEGLPIGLPDFPRKVRRTLPALRPEQEIKVGILKLHPSFLSSIEYDDNIRLSDKDDKDDVIFTQRPGLIGELNVGDHRVEAGYGTEVVSFAKEQEENTINHLAHGVVELNFTDFQLSVLETMNDATGRLFDETSARDHVFLNAVQILGRYDRPMWALESGWTHNTIDHKTPILNNNDYGEDVLAVLGGYKIFPKTLWLVETDVGLVNYDHNVANADQSYWQLFTGLRGELTPKITSTVKIGFQDRQLSDVGGQGPQDDFDGVVADMDILFTPTASDALRAGYERTVQTSTFAGNSWYRQDRLSLSYRKRFARKWIISPIWSWQFNDYPEEGSAGGNTDRREDHFTQLGAELRYEIQEWLSTAMAYNFRARNSNLDSLDYENSRFTFDVTVAF